MIEYTARITSTDTPRVGGRNLITRGDKEKGTIGRYVAYYLHTPIDKAEPFTLSFDVLSVDRPPIRGEFLVLFLYNTRFQTSVYIKYEEGRVRYSCIIDTQDRESYDKGVKANAVYIYPNEGYYNPDKTPDVGSFTIANVKLERGTVATDWTPAPEDVAESVSKVNTSLVSLASTLLDPDEGEIHKLTAQLDKHKEDTDKNFEELSNNPLTIDKDGYWQIWSIKDSKYLTTQYQSRGRDGEPGHSPSPEEVLGTSRFAELLGGEVTSQIVPVAQDLATTNSNITRASNYAIDLINEAQHQLCDLQVLGMSDGGVVEVKRQVSCVSYDYLTPSLGTETNPPQPPQPKYTTQQIPLTLRSSHDALSKQVSNLQVQLTSCTQQLTATKQELAQLKADTTITPVLNTDTRKRGSTLYPQYGDWLLTSDAEEQYISFSGLSAEVGRSIYIQTRKRAYLYSSGHSFYGLPGNSTQGNRWLSNNTTYRFVRAGATSWLVTASSSPYPWT